MEGQVRNSLSAPDKTTSIQTGVISRRDPTGDASQQNTKRIEKREHDKQGTDVEYSLEDKLLQEIIQLQSNIFFLRKQRKQFL